MADGIRRRAACDRCHAQKIRCPKRRGEEVCDRCTKAGAPCVFRPFRQKKPLLESPKEGQSLVSKDGSTQQSTELGEGNTSSGMVRKRRRVDRQINIAGLNASSPKEAAVQWDTIDSNTTAELGADWANAFSVPPEDFTLNGILDDFTFFNQDICPVQDLANPILEFREADLPRFNSAIPESPRRASMNYPVSRASDQMSQPSVPPQPNVPNPRSMPNLFGSGFGSSTTSGPETLRTCISKLSQLSIALVEHETSIPDVSIHDEAGPFLDDLNDCGFPRPMDYSSYSVETTFDLTQRMIEIYPSALTLSTGQRCIASTGFDSPKAMKSKTIPGSSSSDFREPDPPPVSSKLVVDHSLILLVLSCHLRLIAIYEELFKHMAVCIKQRGIARSPQQAMYTPTLKIGEYTAPTDVAVPMQFILLVQFSSQLCQYSGDLLSRLRAANSSSESYVLSHAAAENVKNKADDMFKELGSMKTTVLGLIATC